MFLNLNKWILKFYKYETISIDVFKTSNNSGKRHYQSIKLYFWIAFNSPAAHSAKQITAEMAITFIIKPELYMILRHAIESLEKSENSGIEFFELSKATTNPLLVCCWQFSSAVSATVWTLQRYSRESYGVGLLYPLLPHIYISICPLWWFSISMLWFLLLFTGL